MDWQINRVTFWSYFRERVDCDCDCRGGEFTFGETNALRIDFDTAFTPGAVFEDDAMKGLGVEKFVGKAKIRKMGPSPNEDKKQDLWENC